jgi:hypothetical protein
VQRPTFRQQLPRKLDCQPLQVAVEVIRRTHRARPIVLRAWSGGSLGRKRRQQQPPRGESAHVLAWRLMPRRRS